MTRSLMLEQLRQEYIIAARVKGVPEWRIVWRHALRNTAVPLITVVALSYGGLLEGSVITETVFAWPGLGAYLTGSLLNADMNAVLGATIVVGCGVHRPQPALRPALPPVRPAGARMSLALAHRPRRPAGAPGCSTDTPASAAAGPARPAPTSSWLAFPRQPDGAGRARHRPRC